MRAEFSKQTMKEAWQRCDKDERGRELCDGCHQPFGERRPEYDHDKMAELGGSNELSNCKVLCPKCHRIKTLTEDMPMIWKSNAVWEKRAGLRKSRYRWRR